MLALYTSDAILLDSLSGSESAQSTPLWEQHAENFFDWGQAEFQSYGIDGFFEQLEAFLRPTV